MNEILPCPHHEDAIYPKRWADHSSLTDTWEVTYVCPECHWSFTDIGGTEKEADKYATRGWNERYERTCTYNPSVEDSEIRILRCSNCDCGMHFRPLYCPGCGAKVVKRPDSPLSPLLADNTAPASTPILDPTERAIIDAVQSGQNVEAVVKRENAKRDLREQWARRIFERGA